MRTNKEGLDGAFRAIQREKLSGDNPSVIGADASFEERQRIAEKLYPAKRTHSGKIRIRTRTV